MLTVGSSYVAFIVLREVPFMGFLGGSDSKESTCIVGDLGLIPGWEEPLEEGMATHSSNSCLENSMDRGAWWAVVHVVAKSQLYLFFF